MMLRVPRQRRSRLFRERLPYLIALLALPCYAADNFTPTNRLTAIGVDRKDLSDVMLDERVRLMTEAQTFAIMRDARAMAGAERMTAPKMKKLVEDAANRSGVPASLISAVAFLESFGLPTAESPTGPKGIMQISQATARAMGLRIVYATKYKVHTERRAVKKRHGKPVYRNVKVKTAYSVLVRDERLDPARAIPAAARYLANMEQKFGGLDWAVWAYHCGEGCVAEFLDMARRAPDLKGNPPSVAEVFFSSSLVHNREIWQALAEQMERDYSPTYWFRVRRAEQLLAMYEEDPDDFQKLRDEYRYDFDPMQRAPNRLSAWMKPQDLTYRTCEDIQRDEGTRLVRAMDKPEYFGFLLRRNGYGSLGEFDPEHRDSYLNASPSALGTLLTIVFETRRLFEALHPHGESFVPIEVTGLVRPLDYATRAGREFATGKAHFDALCSGQAFQISLANLPLGERECLRFILDDIGWLGHLGFVEETPGSGALVIGCSPSSRDFFTKVYQEAVGAKAAIQ
jgi:soluble lytic murein transglycosylase-like protein